MHDFFGQTFTPNDLLVVALLIVLEGVLSVDNALVLGLLARRVPKHQQGKALTYGLVGAFVFRFISIAVAAYLLQWRWVKLAGGGYLVYVAVKHFFFEEKDSPEPNSTDTPAATVRASLRHFWAVVIAIELTDIAFAVDSILAAIALVGSRPDKLWVIVTGGMLGVILMRFAAMLFIKLLERFPRFETAAYLLVTVIGLKLLADWGFNSPEHPHRVNFHDPADPVFWAFWGLMILCFLTGFLPRRSSER